MLIISILNNIVKEKISGGLNPRCAAPPPPLSPWGRGIACLPVGRGEGHIGKILNA